MKPKAPTPTTIWPQHSEFATRWLLRNPAWDETTHNTPLHELIHTWSNGIPQHLTETELMAALRQLRQRSMIQIMKRDLLQQSTLTETTEAFSLLAEITVNIAAQFSHQTQVERFGSPSNQDSLIIIGMGKLGGRELNASSDIDLVYVYPQDGETQNSPTGRTQSHAEFFEQVARRINKMISEVTEDGFVFRVDTRLRPNGDAGPLAVTLDMLEEYFIVQGREWERYAWIKARVINQPPSPAHTQAFESATQALHHITQPFVYRKYLDFSTISALRNIHTQIRNEAQKQDQQHPGSLHVKLGRGGIREIEFTAQAFQLIRGGRETKLQTRRTLDVLQHCTTLGLLPPQEQQKLSAAYEFLRHIEHRLQYINDEQTHRLPCTPTEQTRIAQSMWFQHTQEFMTTLLAHMSFVTQHFDTLFGDKNNEDTDKLTPPWEAHLTQGFIDPLAAETRYQALIESGRYRTLPDNHRARVNRLMPKLLSAARQSNAPDSSWRYSCELINTIAKRGTYLSLLEEYPNALNRVSRLLAASPWAAHFLIKHPILLDELLDPRTLLATPQLQHWKTQVEQSLEQAKTPDGTPDLERQMDLIREEHHAQQFRILSQDLEQLLSVERVSDLLSELADHTLDIALQMAWQQQIKRHCTHPQFAIIAYGKHGGKELGYASDLDLIFLYDDAHDNAPELYANLAKRLNRWLSTQTAAGILFETDFRLRPNGESGLLVSNINAFSAYQRKEGGTGAWFWEHQALTRARFCVGDKRIGQQFDTLREEILQQPRDLNSVRQEVINMRKKMLSTHPPKKNGIDLKHDQGGMIDVEFIVQALILGHAHQYPELSKNIGNIALLQLAGKLQLIPSTLAQNVANAYRQLRQAQHRLRLAEQQLAPLNSAEILNQQTIIKNAWKHFMEE